MDLSRFWVVVSHPQAKQFNREQRIESWRNEKQRNRKRLFVVFNQDFFLAFHQSCSTVELIADILSLIHI